MRFAQDRDIALDALQETFCYLLRKFPPEGEGLTLTARLTTLLYPVAKHYALDMRRKADRLSHADSAPEPRATTPVEAGTRPATEGHSDDPRFNGISHSPATSENDFAMPLKMSQSLRHSHSGSTALVSGWMNGCMSDVLRSFFSYQVAVGSAMSE